MDNSLKRAWITRYVYYSYAHHIEERKTKKNYCVTTTQSTLASGERVNEAHYYVVIMRGIIERKTYASVNFMVMSSILWYA